MELKEIRENYYSCEDQHLCATCSMMDDIEEVRAASQAVCEWKEDDIDGKWDTGCGESHSFESGGPEENGHKFCPYCGRKLQPIN